MTYSRAIFRGMALTSFAAIMLLGCSNNSNGGSTTGGNSGSSSSQSGGNSSSGGASSSSTSAAAGSSATSSSAPSSSGGAATGGSSATGGKSETSSSAGGNSSVSGTTAVASSSGGKTVSGGSTAAMSAGGAAGGTTSLGGATGGAGQGGTASGGRTGGTTGTAGRTGTGGNTAAGGTTSVGGSTGGGTCAGTATPCPPTEAGSIAYIGCSMAENIGSGYGKVSGKLMWTNSGYGTGAQCVPNWVEGGSAWGGFDKKLAAMGGKDKVKAIMVQICIISPATDDQVKSMIKAARAHTNPDAWIYLVGQPQYKNGHTCQIAGGKEATTDEQASRLGKDTTIDSKMSYLGKFMMDCPAGQGAGGDCSDSCHANDTGERSLGNQAKAFWGG